MDVWTTPEDSPGLAAAGAVERRFARRLREKTADAEGLGKVVPPSYKKRAAGAR